MASLSEIRAKLLAQNTQQTNSGSSTRDNSIFPHWSIAEGATATLRYLPDADPNNTFFWVEKSMIKLPFAGIKGDANSKPVIVQVPCMEMYGESCPVLTEVRPWFKDKNLEEMGRKYWKKKSYLFQGFVPDAGGYKEENTPPENPIRRFVASAQIFNIVKAALLDPDMEELPTDYLRGVDFKVVKTTKGGYADYSTSQWARRERALSADEQAAIAKYGLHDLKTFLPKKPGPAELQAIKEMFEASVDGEPYDGDRWAQYFKPYGYKGSDTGSTASPAPNALPQAARTSTPAPEAWEDDVAEAESATPAPAPVTTSGASSRAADIMAAIRARQTPQ